MTGQDHVALVDDGRRQLPFALDGTAELAHVPRRVDLNAVRVLNKDVERDEPVAPLEPRSGDVNNLLDEQRVGGALEGLDSVRVQAEGPSHAVERRA
jgi:hypothetical protein